MRFTTMKEFTCEKCGESHNLETFLEFPQPEIISKITSGELKQDLQVIAKSVFGVNNECLLLESELSLKIVDYEDDLEMLVWIEVTNAEFLSKKEQFEELDEVRLSGKLNGYLPFYQETDNLPVEILIETTENELPRVVAINIEHEFRRDFEEGIPLKKAQKILTWLYHV